MKPPLVVYVDVDDTLVRSAGTKRIPIRPVIEHIRQLHIDDQKLCDWRLCVELHPLNVWNKSVDEYWSEIHARK